MASFIITTEGLTLFHDGESFQVTQDNPKWEEIVQAVKDEDWEVAMKLANPIKAVAEYVSGTFKIKDRRVWFDDKTEMHGALADRIISMHEQGFPIGPMVQFIRKLQCNPSNRAVQELYRFLEANDLPITNDGCFMAYKRVDDDFKDQYTHTIDNSPGQTVEMPRNEVNDDCSQTCSHGLHFAALSYVSNYSGKRLVSIKIDPRDVVSIPLDYGNAKGRCCRYEVIAELDLSSALKGHAAFEAAVYEPPPKLFGSGTTRCAHCQNIIWVKDEYVVLKHTDHGRTVEFNVHKTCEQFFQKEPKRTGLEESIDEAAAEFGGSINPICDYCKTSILTTQNSLGVGDGKVVHSSCYNEYRSNRDGSGSA